MLKLGRKELTLEEVFKIVIGEEPVVIEDIAYQKVKENFEFLVRFSRNKIIYGINTGFGPMAKIKVNSGEQIDLQYNLIRSHASGIGKPLADLYVRALMVVRLNSLLQGRSGIHPDVIQILTELINKKVYPVIYEHGSVGASGDLVQLSHLALSLIGEGEVRYKGEIRDTAEVFNELGIAPLQIRLREGLALINGTSVMTGIGLINVMHADNLLTWAVLASSMINEIVETYGDHYSPELNSVKMHLGQQKIAECMRENLKDSKLIKRREDILFRSNADNLDDSKILSDKVQEYYSLRCVPQILGPVMETIENAKRVLIYETNSVNDNPIVDDEHENVYHGGNFHGDYISLEMDKLKLSITRLSMLAERQLNYLMNDKLNDKLPPFVNLGKLGLNLGMQGVQFTATSTVAENQTLSNSMYVHSIPNNNDNQDIVSMGTNSALLAGKVIDNTYEVLAIHFMAIIQAIDYLRVHERLSSRTRSVYEDLRELVPKFVEDTTKYREILLIKKHLLNSWESH